MRLTCVIAKKRRRNTVSESKTHLTAFSKVDSWRKHNNCKLLFRASRDVSIVKTVLHIHLTLILQRRDSRMENFTSSLHLFVWRTFRHSFYIFFSFAKFTTLNIFFFSRTKLLYSRVDLLLAPAFDVQTKSRLFYFLFFSTADFINASLCSKKQIT